MSDRVKVGLGMAVVTAIVGACGATMGIILGLKPGDALVAAAGGILTFYMAALLGMRKRRSANPPGSPPE